MADSLHSYTNANQMEEFFARTRKHLQEQFATFQGSIPDNTGSKHRNS